MDTNSSRNEGQKPFEDYYRRSKNWDPAPLLLRALEMIGPAEYIRCAIDLGCGVGQNTQALVKNNWAVTAVDVDPDAIEGLRERARTFSLHERALLTIQQAEFMQATWPDVDLVVAMNSLPFCTASEFPVLWQRIVSSINPGGMFVGTLFGKRRTWPPGTFAVTLADVARLFAPFRRLDVLFETEEDGQNRAGEPIHWHVYRVIATK